MGLIQRVIEAAGIPTVSISVNRPYTEKVHPPRSIFLRWPFGHPLGEPGHIAQQTVVLCKALEALYMIDTPGQMVDVGWRWRREAYGQQSKSPFPRVVVDASQTSNGELRQAPKWSS